MWKLKRSFIENFFSKKTKKKKIFHSIACQSFPFSLFLYSSYSFAWLVITMKLWKEFINLFKVSVVVVFIVVDVANQNIFCFCFLFLFSLKKILESLEFEFLFCFIWFAIWHAYWDFFCFGLVLFPFLAGSMI